VDLESSERWNNTTSGLGKKKKKEHVWHPKNRHGQLKKNRSVGLSHKSRVVSATIQKKIRPRGRNLGTSPDQIRVTTFNVENATKEQTMKKPPMGGETWKQNLSGTAESLPKKAGQT